MYIGLSLQNADESNLVAPPNQSQNDIQQASTNLRNLPSPIIDFSIPSDTFFGETAETMESNDRQCQNCKGIFKGGTGLATHMRSCGTVNGTAYRKFNRRPKIRKCMKCKKTFKGGTGLAVHLRSCGVYRTSKDRPNLGSVRKGKWSYLSRFCKHCHKRFHRPKQLWGHLAWCGKNRFGADKPNTDKHLTLLSPPSHSSTHNDILTKERNNENLSGMEVTQSNGKRCPKCRQIFKGGTGLAVHMRSCGIDIHRRPNIRQCMKCKKTFKGGTGLAVHMRSCENKILAASKMFNGRPYIRKCMKCKQSFKGGTGLAVHLRSCGVDRIKTDRPNVKALQKDKWSYLSRRCKYCQKKFKRPKQLRGHILWCRNNKDSYRNRHFSNSPTLQIEQKEQPRHSATESTASLERDRISEDDELPGEFTQTVLDGLDDDMDDMLDETFDDRLLSLDDEILTSDKDRKSSIKRDVLVKDLEDDKAGNVNSGVVITHDETISGDEADRIGDAWQEVLFENDKLELLSTTGVSADSESIPLKHTDGKEGNLVDVPAGVTSITIKIDYSQQCGRLADHDEERLLSSPKSLNEISSNDNDDQKESGTQHNGKHVTFKKDKDALHCQYCGQTRPEFHISSCWLTAHEMVCKKNAKNVTHSNPDDEQDGALSPTPEHSREAANLNEEGM